MVRAKKSLASGVSSGGGMVVRAKKARVSGTGQLGASSSLNWKVNSNDSRRDPREKFWARAPSQFAVFRLSFKVSEQYRCRNLFGIITIDDGSVSDDIYRGCLHKAEEGDSSRLGPHDDLLLTGPHKFIEAMDPVCIMVAIYDMDDPKSSIPLANADTSRGTLPAQCSTPDLFSWCWYGYGKNFRYNEVHSRDLIQDQDALPLDFFTFGSCGSLLLRYAVFPNSVVAKVEVKVMARRQHICGGIVTAKFDPCEEDIVLYRRKASDCSCQGASEEEIPEHQQPLLPLDLSRSSVTMPCTASCLTVRAVLLDRDNNVIVNGSAQLSVPDYLLLGPFCSSRELISGRTRAQAMVIVTWTGPVMGEPQW